MPRDSGAGPGTDGVKGAYPHKDTQRPTQGAKLGYNDGSRGSSPAACATPVLEVVMLQEYTPKDTSLLSCVHCGARFAPRKRAHIYCNPRCRTLSENARRQVTNPNRYAHLPVGTVGALHELVVSADLMRLGFHVFRALSPACPCDLVVITGSGSLVRVEVKTSNRRPDGRNVPNLTAIDQERADVYAFVSQDGEILYFPDWGGVG